MYAVGFPRRVRLLESSRRFTPVIEGHWAHVDAYAVAGADFPIQGNVGSVDRQLGWVRVAPDFVAVMFACNLSFGFKIRVNWQKQFTTSRLESENIRFSTAACDSSEGII